MNDSPEICTIGHWTWPIPDFLAPLDEHHIELLADVRAHPGSRRNPQFGSDAMAGWLPKNGIDYLWMSALGGRRPRQDVDPEANQGWQNVSFKNYADYTLTDAYRSAIDELTTIARTRRVAIMCGEPMPWRCHRLLIANTLTAQSWKVEHLIAGGVARPHVLGQWGATPSTDCNGQLTYPTASQKA